MCGNGCIRHLPTIMAAMLNENDEMYWVGDQRTTIYNHSQPAHLTTQSKHTVLYREPLPSCFYCPSLQLLDRGDGKAFSRLRYSPRAGRCVWAMPSEKWMTGKDKGNGGWGKKGEESEREEEVGEVDVCLPAVKGKCFGLMETDIMQLIQVLVDRQGESVWVNYRGEL